jgi:hypothetical protein
MVNLGSITMLLLRRKKDTQFFEGMGSMERFPQKIVDFLGIERRIRGNLQVGSVAFVFCYRGKLVRVIVRTC